MRRSNHPGLSEKTRVGAFLRLRQPRQCLHIASLMFVPKSKGVDNTVAIPPPTTTAALLATCALPAPRANRDGAGRVR